MNDYFVKGYICPKCGPSRDSIKKTISKVKRDVCKACGAIMSDWQRPLNERHGRCKCCGQAAFKLALIDGVLMRECKNDRCREMYDTDNQKIVRKGVFK